MKKLLKVLVVAAMLLIAGMPVVCAESDISDFEYTNCGTYIAITMYNGTDRCVEIPSEIDGLPVQEVSLSTINNLVNPYVREIVLPDAPIRLGDYAFRNIRYLESIEGLENVTHVGQGAFTETGIKELVFSDALEEIGFQAFLNCDLVRITMPDDVILPWDNPLSGFYLEKITLVDGSGEATVKLLDGMLVSADGETLICYPGGWNEVSFRIPDSIRKLAGTAIGMSWRSGSLMELSIPATLEEYYWGSIKASSRYRLFVAPDSAGLEYAQQLAQYYSICDYVVVEDGDASQSISTRVKEIVASCTSSDMTDLEKARAIIDWCAENVTYGWTWEQYSAYDVLFNGVGISSAYADAYLLLMTELGIPCKVVALFNHALNAIQIDGEWVYVDPTNCTGSTMNARYRLFAFEDTILEKFYGGVDLDFGMVDSSTARYHYYYTSGQLDDNIAYVSNGIQEKLESGEQNFTIEEDLSLLNGDNDISNCLTAVILAEKTWIVNGSEVTIYCTYSDGVFYVTYDKPEEEMSEFTYDTVDGMVRITGYVGDATEVTIPEILDGYTVGYIGTAFTNKRNLEKVTLPDTIRGIDPNAFKECVDLKEINFPTSLESIGSYAFEKCYLLESDVVLPEGLASLGEQAFSYCYSISTVSLPGTLAVVTDMAFMECYNLTSLTLNEGIVVLDGAAFSDCERLGEVTLPESLQMLGNNVFGNTALKTLHIPANVSVINRQLVRDCANLVSVTIAPENQWYAIIDGVCYATDNGVPTVLKFGLLRSGLTELDIPGTVVRIDNAAMKNHPTLKRVHIPGSVKLIAERAFSGCPALETVTMGEGVETLDYAAFADCHALKSIELADSITTLKGTALSGNISIRRLKIPKGITSVAAGTIPVSGVLHLYVHDDVTFIGELSNYTNPYVVYVYGTPGTYAETFAKENGYIFAEEGVIYPEAVTLSAQNVYVRPGESFRIDLLVEPDGAVLDEVQYSNIAYRFCTVDETGLFTATAEGSMQLVVSCGIFENICDIQIGTWGNRLTLDPGVTHIEEGAFLGTRIIEADLSAAENLTISKDAFSDCDILRRVILPENVVLEDGAFDGLTSTLLLCRNETQAAYARRNGYEYILMPAE